MKHPRDPKPAGLIRLGLIAAGLIRLGLMPRGLIPRGLTLRGLMPRGLIALRLIAFGLGALWMPAAHAQLQAYYHAGAWDAFSGRTDSGGAVCGIGNTNAAASQRLSIRFDIGGRETTFSASKPDWSIPDKTPIRVVMQVGLNTPSTRQASGHGRSIDWPMDRPAMQSFDQQFRGASSMTLTFPDGNEPPWTVSLAGSSAISDALDRCVRDLTRQVQAQQPPAGGAPPAPGTPPQATQPFSPAAAAPPTEAVPPGATPNGTQPGATAPPH